MRKDIWGENAETFNPDNFLPENEEKRSKYAYLPFSFGPRQCVGQRYAMLNMRILIAHILMNYKLSTSLKLEDLTYILSLTTNIEQGCLVRIERR